MNANNHKTVFSERLGTLVAVGENARSQGKANGAGLSQGIGAVGGFVGALAVGFALVGLAWAGPVVTALPTGGQVAQGTASISQSGAVMSITQSTAKAVVNWSSFDIGSQAKVNITQPGADAVMLNRVTGANPSQIFGQFNANGQVVLVNPNGVLFGKDGSVNAISFTASTLGITDANFMAGNLQYERNGATAAVINQGSIKTTGGYVALLGASVSNEGSIQTQGGTAYLAAADAIKVPVSGSGRIKLELSPSSLNAAVSNANGATIMTEGGQVYMQAAALNNAVASIIQSGSIDTTGAQGGAVMLLADGGVIQATGDIKANSIANQKGGDIIIGRNEVTGVLAKSTNVSGAKLESKGGFVETSGDYLTTTGVLVNAQDWLLDPANITIASSGATGLAYNDPNVTGGNYAYSLTATSTILNTDIQNSLNHGTSVKISTGLGTPAVGSEGNITVNASIVKNSGGNATLTLEANNKITINSGVQILGSSTAGNLDVVLTANGANKENANSIYVGPKAQIDTNGTVTINATGYGATINNSAILVKSGDFLANTTNNTASSARTLIRGSSVSINATVNGANGFGFVTENSVGIESTSGNVNIQSTHNSAATTGAGIWIGTNWSSLGPSAGAPANPYVKSAGTINLETITQGSTASGHIELSDAVVTANGNVTVKAQSQQAGMNAVKISSTFNAPVVSSSTGDVSITANQGDILISDLGANSIEGSAVRIVSDTASNATAAVNIAAKPGGGSITATKTLTVSGTNTNTSSGAGVLIRGSGALTLQGSGVDITGQSAGGSGIDVSATSSKITATSGDINLLGSSTAKSGYGVKVQGATVTASSGTVTLDGTTAADNRPTASGTYAYAGVMNLGSTVQGKNIILKASATNTSADVLGYYGAGSLVASDTLTADTSASGVGVGFYTWGSNGITQAANGVIIKGTSNQGSGVFIDSSSKVVNTTSGSIDITGATNKADNTQSAIGLTSSTIQNTNGGVTLTSTKGSIQANTGASTISGKGAITIAAGQSGVNSTDTDGIDGTTLTITQNGNAQTTLMTRGSGNVTIPKIVNNGTGNVVIVAGSGWAAGNGNGGQVLTVGSGNSIANNNANTYIYSGNIASTGSLASLGGFTDLLLDGPNQNIQMNTASAGTATISNGSAKAQVMFREKANFNFGNVLKGGTYTGKYGDANTQIGQNNALWTSVQNTLKQQNTGNTLSATLGNNTVKISASTVIDALTGDLQGASYSQNGNGYLNANSTGYVYNTTNNSQYNVGFATGQVVKAVVIPKAIVVSGITANNKIYDGNTAATVVTSNAQFGGMVTGDNLTVVTTGTFSDKNVANGKTVTLSGAQYGGTDAGNYTFTGQASTTANITPKAVTVSGITADNKTYDGNTAATVVTTNAQFGGMVAGDNLTVATTGTFSDKNVANGKTVALSGVQYGGTDAGNYSFIDQASTTANITPKAVTVSGITANNKIYDGNTAATVVTTNAQFGGMVTGDNLTVATTGTFSDKNVANGKTVALSGVQYGGTDAGNYSFTDQASTTANITPKSVTVSGITGNNKIYDGNTAATVVTTNTQFGGMVTGDNLTVVTTGTFSDKNVANGKTVALSGVQYGGTDAGNYIFTDQASTTANITPKSVTVSGITANNKIYDGNTTASLNVTTTQLNGAIAGDSVSAVSQAAVGNFSSMNVVFDANGAVATQSVTVSGLSLSGADAGNYTVSDKFNASAKVLQRPLSITGSVAQDKKADGTTVAQISPGTLSNLVTGESLVLTATGQFDTAVEGSNKAVATQYALANGSNGIAKNYSVPAAEVLRAAILAANVNPVQPVINPFKPSGGGRVVVAGSSSSGAALGVTDDEDIINRQECSVLNPEKCECQESTIFSVELCFAPGLTNKSETH